MRLKIGMEGPTGTVSADDENLGFRLALRDAPVEFLSVARTTPDNLLADARRLIQQDDVFMLLNFYGGPESSDISALSNESGVPYLFPHTFLLPAWPGSYTFSSYPRPDIELPILRRYCAEQGFKRVAVLQADNIYGSLYEQALGSSPSVIVASSSPSGLQEELGEILSHGPDAVVLAVYPGQAKKAMEAKALLKRTSARFISAGPLTDEQFLNVEGGSDGIVGFCYYPDPSLSQEPGVVDYRRAMAASYPGHPLNRYSLYGYVHGLLTLEGLRRADFSSDRDRFVQAMESIRDWDSGGIMPPVTFSRMNHHAQYAGKLCEMRGGRLVPFTDWISE